MIIHYIMFFFSIQTTCFYHILPLQKHQWPIIFSTNHIINKYTIHLLPLASVRPTPKWTQLPRSSEIRKASAAALTRAFHDAHAGDLVVAGQDRWCLMFGSEVFGAGCILIISSRLWVSIRFFRICIFCISGQERNVLRVSTWVGGLQAFKRWD